MDIIFLPRIDLETDIEYQVRVAAFNYNLQQQRLRTSLAPMILKKGFKLIYTK